MTLSTPGLGPYPWRRLALIPTAVLFLSATQGHAERNAPQINDGQAAARQKITPQREGIGRYSMTPAQGGFLRLDTKTGAVSLCAVQNGNVTCKSSADERAAMQAEISRLVQQNAKLQADLKSAAKSTGQRLKEILPTDKDMDKALTYAEKLMRRMMRIMREEDKQGDKI